MATHDKSAIPVLNGTDRGCWSCGDMTAAQFCHACGKVQPPAPTDYFSFFGLPRKLNVNTAALEREMHALSRHLHPDLAARASAQEQDWSLEQSSRLNDAYRTLRDSIARTEYLLRLEGVKSPEKSQQRQNVPPDLLEEVFELKMQVEELRAGDKSLKPEIESARHQLEAKLNGCMTELQKLWTAWDRIVDSDLQGEIVEDAARARVLEGMVALLNRRRYLANSLQEVEAALNA